jgi:hypothetical protein
VAPLLFIMLFGIIDYGIWFADSIGMRQGVREAARAGVVERFDDACAPPRLTGGDPDLRALACTAAEGSTTITGNPAIRIVVLDAVTGAPGAPWAPGNTLRVCAQLRHDALLPLIPMPDGGIVRTRVDMAIEVAENPPITRAGGQDAPPPGADWGWC